MRRIVCLAAVAALAACRGEPIPPTTTIRDQAPAPATTDTQHATQTGGRAVTGTHLATRP